MTQDGIFISIASYRDPDLVNTVKSLWENADSPDKLFFSIFSHGENDEHADLSFIPNNQIRYQKEHWSLTTGVCRARYEASQNINKKFFFQIDSHARFRSGWDSLVTTAYEKCKTFWGNRIVLTTYPDAFEIDWEPGPPKDRLHTFDKMYDIFPIWSNELFMVYPDWREVEISECGNEVFFFSANSCFTTKEIIEEVPYDPNLYFAGEEPTMALRLYTRGIRMINSHVRFMFNNYTRENGRRTHHWKDQVERSKELDLQSFKRVKDIQLGKDLGVYGIGSRPLYEQYQKITDIKFDEKIYHV